MAGGAHGRDPAAREQLAEGRRRVRETARTADPRAATLHALQRTAGNAAVAALMAGRWRSRGGAAVEKIDTALREIRRDEPAVEKVEPGLRAAKDTGVPVDLDGYAQKPPASALDVVRTGFGPGAVPGRKPVPPPKRTPPKSPLAAASGPARQPAGPPGKAAGGPVAAAPIPEAAAVPDVLAPPAPPTRTAPTEDPGFGHVTGAVSHQARTKKAHPPAAAKAKEAQDAALAPSGDVDGQAKAAKVDTMDAQRPGGFDKKAFIAAVKAAIEAKSPKNLNEAADYGKSGKAGEVKGAVKGLVAGDKQTAAQDVETATAAPPDPATAVPKHVTPMPAEQPGQPQAVPAAAAVPKPAPPDQLNLAAGKHETDREMAEGEVTDQQLKESGEPEFEGAVAAKQEAAQHADTAPAAFRAEEKDTLAQARTDANQRTAATTAGMHGGRLAALAKVVAGKAATKSKDEARRAEVTTKVQGIFAATETAVKKILTGVDPKVDKEFEAGEKGARAAFEGFVSAKMSAYKKDRYGGWLGKFRWVRDKLRGMPSKVNEFFTAGRELYLKEMDKVISRVAEIVARDLTAAKDRIAAGRSEIATYVKGLPRDLQKVGTQATKEIGDQFSQLETDVDAKQNALVNALASKYVEARKGLDDRIEELQAENRGLIDKAIGAIKAVVNTIRQLAAMLRDVFVRAAGVVGQIIKSPGRFLGNLVAGVKGGIQRFASNILTHLREGLMGWLFGSLAKGGIELPGSFDLRGIVTLLASIFGLTWANIRARLVAAVGERAVGLMVKSVDVFAKLKQEGVSGIWHLIVEKIGDVKELIVEKAKSYVVTEIVMAGIEWLIGLLNPVSAFIKACKLIYQIVMFFVENASRIKRFVDTILDSVGDIARGAVGGVIEKVEGALAQMVPILIGFLARVLGLSGIGERIRGIVAALQKPVNKALDAVIATGLKLAGPVIRAAKGIGAKVKAKVDAGKAYVKGKVYGGDDSPEGKRRRLDLGMKAGMAVMDRFAGRRVGEALLRPGLAAVRVRYGMTALEARQTGAVWTLHGEVNPTEDKPTTVGVPGLQPPAGTAADAPGAVALYRGIHFEKAPDDATDEEKARAEANYQQEWKRDFTKRPMVSEAARALAGSRRADGSDVPPEQLDEAVQLVQSAVVDQQRPEDIAPPWQKPTATWQSFKSYFYALLHLYVDDLRAFREQMREGAAGAERVGFTGSPFISTTRDATHAVRYAQGRKATAPERRRTEDVRPVGKVFIYLFKIVDLARQAAVDPLRLAKDNKIGMDLLKRQEGEITFTGAVPAENLEAEKLVRSYPEDEQKKGEERVAQEIREIARSRAAAYGGYVHWPSK